MKECQTVANKYEFSGHFHNVKYALDATWADKKFDGM